MEFIWKDRSYGFDLQNAEDCARLDHAYGDLVSLLLMVSEAAHLQTAPQTPAAEAETLCILQRMFTGFFETLFPGCGTEICGDAADGVSGSYAAFLAFAEKVRTAAEENAHDAADAIRDACGVLCGAEDPK